MGEENLLFLFSEVGSVASVTVATKLLGVTVPGGGDGDWMIIFTGTADGHNGNGVVDCFIELYVNGVAVPAFATYTELKTDIIAATRATVGSPVGGLSLTYILPGLTALTTLDIYGDTSAGVGAPYDTGGIDFFTLHLAAVRLAH